MQYSPLGSSGIKVSRVCLGSMTWGKQNTQSDADEQIAYALEQGVNFIDTAEMYAVPPSPETYGKTEEIIGDWLSRNQQKRSDVVLATKIAAHLGNAKLDSFRASYVLNNGRVGLTNININGVSIAEDWFLAARACF